MFFHLVPLQLGYSSRKLSVNVNARRRFLAANTVLRYAKLVAHLCTLLDEGCLNASWKSGFKALSRWAEYAEKKTANPGEITEEFHGCWNVLFGYYKRSIFSVAPKTLTWPLWNGLIFYASFGECRITLRTKQLRATVASSCSAQMIKWWRFTISAEGCNQYPKRWALEVFANSSLIYPPVRDQSELWRPSVAKRNMSN